MELLSVTGEMLGFGGKDTQFSQIYKEILLPSAPNYL